jgi:SAM-dependent methyltransferase
VWRRWPGALRTYAVPMVSRARALSLRNALDDWLPPVLRDSRWFMAPLLRLALGRDWRTFADFKPRGPAMSAEAFSEVYSGIGTAGEVQGETDLNPACTEAILRHAAGRVLDVGCGRGYLAERLTEVSHDVTGVDIVLYDGMAARDGLRFVEGSVESLPFADGEFDTVVCTHTLEHVQRLGVALTELRRVARRQLIIVVPRERPYRYSFNLHLHFFPYPWSWEAVAGVVPGATLTDLRDWFYLEPQPPSV